MTDSTLQLHYWVIPLDPQDLAPLPVLVRRDPKSSRFLHFYDRKQKAFEDFPVSSDPYKLYDSFDECRAAMIDARVNALNHARERARQLAQQIEHIRTIPTANFPDVLSEVSEAQQQKAKAEGQEEAKAEEVKPALKRPRKNG